MQLSVLGQCWCIWSPLRGCTGSKCMSDPPLAALEGDWTSFLCLDATGGLRTLDTIRFLSQLSLQRMCCSQTLGSWALYCPIL